MWELNYKESWVSKNWCFWTVLLEKPLEIPWTARRSNQSILKEISPGCSLEGLMVKLKGVLSPPYVKSWLIGKDSNSGRDWGQEEKGTTEDEMAALISQTEGWGSLFEISETSQRKGATFRCTWEQIIIPTRWTWVWVNSRVGDGQRGLACCNSWGRKESDTTERLNWTELNV